MEIFAAATLDDLMNDLLTQLLSLDFNVDASKGRMSEIIGPALFLTNPRARISRTETRGKPFSALGEFLWYLSKDNSLQFIEYYIARYNEFSDDGETIYGGYGKRLFNMHDKFDQISNVIELLTRKKTSRQATIQIFDAEDIVEDRKDIPCTCTLQFLIRDEKLHMITYMRSNDAIWGLPHDIFSFTMIQEIIARTLNIEIGNYRHFVGSLHLYENKKDLAKKYLSEGFQSTKTVMPPMPIGNPWPSLEKLQEIEFKIRSSSEITLPDASLDVYWNDLALLLQIFSLTKNSDNEKPIQQAMSNISNKTYIPYIEKRLVS